MGDAQLRSPFQLQHGDESPHSEQEHYDSPEQTGGRVRGFDVSRAEGSPLSSVRHDHQVAAVPQQLPGTQEPSKAPGSSSSGSSTPTRQSSLSQALQQLQEAAARQQLPLQPLQPLQLARIRTQSSGADTYTRAPAGGRPLGRRQLGGGQRALTSAAARLLLPQPGAAAAAKPPSPVTPIPASRLQKAVTCPAGGLDEEVIAAALESPQAITSPFMQTAAPWQGRGSTQSGLTGPGPSPLQPLSRQAQAQQPLAMARGGSDTLALFEARAAATTAQAQASCLTEALTREQAEAESLRAQLQKATAERDVLQRRAAAVQQQQAGSGGTASNAAGSNAAGFSGGAHLTATRGRLGGGGRVRRSISLSGLMLEEDSERRVSLGEVFDIERSSNELSRELGREWERGSEWGGWLRQQGGGTRQSFTFQGRQPCSGGGQREGVGEGEAAVKWPRQQGRGGMRRSFSFSGK